MASYILLLTLTPEGRDKMLADPDNLMAAMQDIDITDTSVLGSYAVLGAYDFVTILRAPDNDAAARFSMELGVRAGARPAYRAYRGRAAGEGETARAAGASPRVRLDPARSGGPGVNHRAYLSL